MNISRRAVFIIGACLITVIALVNFISMRLDLYWLIKGFDNIMHFIGGAWLGVMGLWWLARKQMISYKQALLTMSAFALFFGAGWELFEWVLDVLTIKIHQPTMVDTIDDIMYDWMGALTAFLTTVAITRFFEKKYE